MNFINKISDKDKDLFFGPVDSKDEFIEIQDHWNMANIIHIAGIFSSISQARKNGWNKPIPNGFTILTIGKKAKRKEIFILKV